ncbi:MAG: hypothetical protein FDZ70_08825, partial [Actinobacteria bacterium]
MVGGSAHVAGPASFAGCAIQVAALERCGAYMVRCGKSTREGRMRTKRSWLTVAVSLLLAVSGVPASAQVSFAPSMSVGTVAPLARVGGAPEGDALLKGGYLYAPGPSGLQIFDVTGADAPVLVGDVLLPGYPFVVSVDAGLAAVGCLSGPVQVVDVSDPAEPRALGAWLAGTQTESWSAVEDVCVLAGRLYVTSHDRGLEIVSLANPASPVRLGAMTPAMMVRYRNIAVSGVRAYLEVQDFARHSTSLQIVDVANPTLPAPRGVYDTN